MPLVIRDAPQDGSVGTGGQVYLEAVAEALTAHPNWQLVESGSFTYSAYTYKQVWKSLAAGNRNGQDFHLIIGTYNQDTGFAYAVSEGWDITAHLPIYPVANQGEVIGVDLGLGGGSPVALVDVAHEFFTVANVHQPYITVGASQATFGLHGSTNTYVAGQIELPPGHADPAGLISYRFNGTGSSSSSSPSGHVSRDVLGTRAASRSFGLGGTQHTYPSTLLRVGDLQDGYLDARLALGGRVLLECWYPADVKYRGLLPGLSFDQAGGVALGDTLTIEGETYVVVCSGDPIWALGTLSDG